MEPFTFIIEVPCPLCGSHEKECVEAQMEDVEVRFPGRYTISRCLNCGFLFLSRRPSAAALSDCYGENYHTRTDFPSNFFTKWLYKMKYNWRFRRLNRILGSVPETLLEIGCGNSSFLAYLENRWGMRCRLAGMDLFPEKSCLRPDSNVRLIKGVMETMEVVEGFDVVVMYQVLEHLDRPLEALQKIAKCLKPGGLLVGQVPNWRSPFRRLFPRYWAGLQIPRHLSFFDKDSLKKMIEEGPWVLEKMDYTCDPGDLGLSLCNWLTDILDLKTLPRRAWFYYPLHLACAPIVFLGLLFSRKSGEMEFVARKIS